MRNKLFESLVLCLVILLFLVSCSKKIEKKISIALFRSPSSASLIKLSSDFEKETGIKVMIEILPYDDLKAKIEQNFLTKSSSYDVLMADCIWIPSFVERNYLGKLDINAYKSGKYDFEDVFPALDDYLGKYPKNGIRYGMPFMSNTHMMTYRFEIVAPIAKSLGIPLPGKDVTTAWTWDQYFQVALNITEKYKNSNPRIYGTSLQARAGAWIIYEWYSELFGFVMDDNARITGLPKFNEYAAKAIQYYADLYKAAPADTLTWGHEEETSAICSGLCAMDATNNVELASNLLNQNCLNKDTLKFAFPPRGLSGKSSPDMGGYGLFLSSFTKFPREASAFILWAADKDIHKKIVDEGGSPIRISEINDPQILNKFPYLKFYDKLIEASVYRARIPKWPELQDIISRELTLVMKEKKSANDAANSIQQWVIENIK